MTRVKTRPTLGAPITPEMTHRDQASALGISPTELWRWKNLAALPEPEFEGRLGEHKALGNPITARSLLGGDPARDRVQRAAAIYKSMTPPERGDFLTAIGMSAFEPAIGELVQRRHRGEV